jgi:hypothetical protein
MENECFDDPYLFSDLVDNGEAIYPGDSSYFEEERALIGDGFRVEGTELATKEGRVAFDVKIEALQAAGIVCRVLICTSGGEFVRRLFIKRKDA